MSVEKKLSRITYFITALGHNNFLSTDIYFSQMHVLYKCSGTADICPWTFTLPCGHGLIQIPCNCFIDRTSGRIQFKSSSGDGNRWPDGHAESVCCSASDQERIRPVPLIPE